MGFFSCPEWYVWAVLNACGVTFEKALPKGNRSHGVTALVFRLLLWGFRNLFGQRFGAAEWDWVQLELFIIQCKTSVFDIRPRSIFVAFSE